MSSKKIMIGGQALRQHGHDRHTDDVDYATYGDGKAFVIERTERGEVLDLAYLGEFGKSVWSAMQPDATGVADAQSLAELKGLALYEHVRASNWRKVAADEYDMAFLGREFGIRELPFLRQRIGEAAAREVEAELIPRTR